MLNSPRAGLCAFVSRPTFAWVGAALLAATISGQGLAQDAVFVESDGSSAAGYWSPGRLMRAKPLDVPQSALSLEELEVAAEALLDDLAEQVAGYGAYPVGDERIAADLAARIHPALPRSQAALPELDELDVADAEADPMAPADVGSSGAYFSSSRLVPTDARLSYPYSTVGKLFFTQPGVGNFVCSAAVLRPRIILTAGHCLHRGSGGNAGFFSNFLFVPAFHQGQAPYQTWDWSFAVTTVGWNSSNGNVPNSADFGILVARDRSFGGTPTRIGNVTGWLGYRTNALLPNHVKLIGYPVNFDSGQITHQVDAQHFSAAGAGTVIYGSDMTGGSSGGPWVENFGVPASGQTGGLRFFVNRVVGVTSYGPRDNDVPKYQGSSVLNQEFLQILQIACNRAPGNC